MTIRLILAFAIAFFVASGVGAFLVPFLRKIKAGQAIREDGPRWHMSKSGTPTMGGLMFIAAIAVVCLTVGFEPMMNGDWGHIFCFVFALIFGAIGFLDDYEKLRKKQNLGKAFEHAPLPFHLKGMEDIKRQCNIQTEIDHVFASCLSNDILFSHQKSDCNQQKHHQLHVHHILKCHF